MLSFFPVPYPDELLYSVVGRYHLRSGNSSPKWTLNNLFGTDSMVLNAGLPSHLSAFCQKVLCSTRIEVEDWIESHTLFSLYAPFMPKERANQLKGMMKSSNGSGIHALVGLSAGVVAAKEALCFCPICYDEDIIRYGEPYWHRSHQALGVFVCAEHRCLLHVITSPKEDRHGLTILPISRDLFESRPCLPSTTTDKTIAILANFSLDISNVLTTNEVVCLYSSKGLLLPRLAERGYVTPANRIRQAQLHEQFIAFYGEDFLELLESDISKDSSWLNFATRKERRVISPVRYVLLIRFLYGSWNDFIQAIGNKYQPFGNKPWPCLNRAADHFGKNVVQSLQISRCSDTGRPIGIFACECGFIYSRRGPDQSTVGRMHIGRVREYGLIWINKARQYLKEGLSLRQTARMLGVDVGTVIKYTRSDSIETFNYEKKSKVVAFQGSSMKQVCSCKATTNRVNWFQRDQVLSSLVAAKCKEMLQITDQKPVRVRFTTVAKRIAKLSLLENRKDKLPETMAALERHIESVEQFQIRRLKWAARKQRGTYPLKKWELIKTAGLRSNYSEAVGLEIEKHISQTSVLYVVDEVI
ncbi:TnsD family Tn7-like transposition protein [Paenibacillus chondroitinus]|uniref:TnsD family Tn7-like transposition protein n=1 Tax=Paenibacillus chondroitinus TaxID=59842 RepID=A0ABU6D497_9BACL|nr:MULTISPECIES: TnsD family Tn7-like transposition protein [Paenibacillus]MCY9661295.1 TnsD family transposase [Paenibacillus anseongense]MEB4792549.1 TnsD family Tn7-like transposition protein [Paenibacillus chondroitinus]